MGMPVLNVGWLGERHSFPIGDTPAAFRQQLFRFCQDVYVVLICRGYHACEFCDPTEQRWFEIMPAYGESAGWAAIGDGEIRVIGRDVVYAAPAMIYHYVTDHNYRPPPEFIEAVANGDPDSPEHESLRRELNDY